MQRTGVICPNIEALAFHASFPSPTILVGDQGAIPVRRFPQILLGHEATEKKLLTT